MYYAKVAEEMEGILKEIRYRVVTKEEIKPTLCVEIFTEDLSERIGKVLEEMDDVRKGIDAEADNDMEMEYEQNEGF